jgi:dephospho-CoA kinase
MVVGITGGIGSGKSFVAQCFLKFENTVYYHADAEAKSLMNSSEVIRKNVQKAFGEEAYKEGKLNRPYIAAIVFNNPAQLAKLNQIVHPEVRKHFQHFIQKQPKNTLIIYENAILFEIGSDVVCDYVITVSAPLEMRIQRVMKRDQVSREEVEKRIQNQWSETQKTLHSNYSILNINKEETMLKVRDIHNILTKK